ncbi:hypothetical protein N0V94_002409 [Neodidymelliopsis sp. IMI 364377]|nr:hypothetical protein N0V94_002409 [Neodidymelliopsis sp. IMI 364377]
MDTEIERQVSSVSLGMLIIDEIRMPSKPPLLNVIGGSSTFVTLGLRLFTNNPSTIGCLVLAGSDFPSSVEAEVQNWGSTLVLKKLPDKQSSRGLLTYEDNTFGAKTFEYTSPPIRAAPSDLIDTPLLRAEAFHFFGRPEEILEQVPELLRLRNQASADLRRPFIIWEPLPSSCTPSNLQKFLEACRLVDVFSPNHLELQALFPNDTPTSDDSTADVERLGNVFVDSGISPTQDGAVVIRAGSNGAMSLSRYTPTMHVPAFYSHGDERVIDPTGAGNAFLGGYIAGWLQSEPATEKSVGDGDEQGAWEALCCGSVAASFALEQIGLPRAELVNGRVGEERLREYKARLVGKGREL